MSGVFTPGPWYIEPNGYDCAGFATSVCGADGLPVASCDNNDFALQKANANLIAAAPELYDGCNALLGLLQLLLGRDDLPAEVREAMQTSHRVEDAEAAVAKARGAA